MSKISSENSSAFDFKGDENPAPRFWFLSKKFQQDASLLIKEFWKFRRFTFIGLIALVIVDLLELIPPYLLKLSVDSLVEKKPVETLFWFGGFYILVALAQGVCRYFWRMYLIRTSMLAGHDLRALFTNHIFRLSSRFFDRKPIGDLMSHATNDTEAIRLALGPGVMVIADAFFYFLTVPTMMFILSPRLALIAFIPLMFVPLIVIRNERLIDKRFEKVQEKFSNLSSMAQENITGVRLVKGFANEAEQIERFNKIGLDYSKLNVSLARVQSTFGPTLDFFMSLSLVILIAVGGKAVLNEAITIGTFVAFQRYIQKLVWPMEAIGYAVTFYQRAVASSKRIKRVLSETSDVKDVSNPMSKEIEGRIEFRNLAYRYDTQDPMQDFDPAKVQSVPSRSTNVGHRAVLQDINLVIEPGMKVAFVGGIGSGKSTLFSLLVRLYPAPRGQMFLDGIDILDWSLESLRRQIAVVTQDAFLFSDTIRSNIEFGEFPQEESTPSFDRVTRAAMQACVDQEINRFDKGYETKVGERGITVSGGQRGRMTLARALIKNARILILDDALAAVDVETEKKILNELQTVANGRTTLIAAHRISTVRNADLIVVLKDGQMVESGSHRKLLGHKNGVYTKFYEQQRLREDAEKYARQLEKEL